MKSGRLALATLPKSFVQMRETYRPIGRKGLRTKANNAKSQFSYAFGAFNSIETAKNLLIQYNIKGAGTVQK
jgi:hypothetical protein